MSLFRNSALLACVLILISETVAVTAQSAAPATSPDRQSLTATVTYVGSGRVYFDKGGQEGLTVGTSIQIKKGKHPLYVTIEWAGDHRAAASLDVTAHKIKPGAKVTYLSQTPASVATAKEKEILAQTSPIPDPQLEEGWKLASQVMPKLLVYQRKNDIGGTQARANIQVATHYRARLWLGPSDRGWHEQRVSLFADGKNLGVEGFGLRIRGRVDVRYDSETDRFLTGDRALPVIREMAFRYHAPKIGLFTSFGRIHPLSRIANIADGAELGWGNEFIRVSAYGGLKPDGLDLLPRLSYQLYGLNVAVTPDLPIVDWRIGTEYVGENGASGLARNAIGFNTDLKWDSYLFVDAAAILDIVDSADHFGSTSGPQLSLFSSTILAKPHDIVGLKLAGRYINTPVFTDVADDLPSQWLLYLEGRTHVRVDGGPTFRIDETRNIEVVAYWDRKRFDNFSGEDWAGGGLTYREDRVRGLPLSIDVSLTYAGLSGHQAGADLNLSGDLYQKVLWISGGLSNLWSLNTDSGNHTLRQSPYFRLEGEPVDGLTLSLLGNAGFEYGLIRGATPFGSWYLAQAGISYDW
jgi:hypothetical protein